MARSQRQTKVPKAKPIKMKVKFIEDCTLGDGVVYKATEIYDLPAPSAYRWIRRGKAERIVEHIEPKKKPGRPKKIKEEVEEKKSYEEEPSFPITFTDPTPEIERESLSTFPYRGKEE